MQLHSCIISAHPPRYTRCNFKRILKKSRAEFLLDPRYIINAACAFDLQFKFCVTVKMQITQKIPYFDAKL